MFIFVPGKLCFHTKYVPGNQVVAKDEHLSIAIKQYMGNGFWIISRAVKTGVSYSWVL